MQREIEVIEPKKHITTDIVEVIKPQLPSSWDYDKSVIKTKGLILNWNKITGDILMELWIAREILSKPGRPKTGTVVPVNKTWNTYCNEVGLWKRTANRWLRRWTTKEETDTPPFPIGEHYSIIYADPPWRYDFSETTTREIEKQYPTMDLKELKKLKKDLPKEDNILLFMWATAPKLREALELIEAWDFDYKTHAVWDKQKIGMGYWFRGQHELLMVAVRGDFSPPKQKERVSSIFRIPRTKHSKKPDEIRELISKWYPKHKKIELFAREAYKDWEVWGNEIKR